MSTPAGHPVDDATTVLTNTAVEAICRLYYAAHVAQGDFEQLPDQGEAVEFPDDIRPVLLRYFGADFAVGMSLAALAVREGWRTLDELIEGVRSLSREEFVKSLLCATTLEEKDGPATAKVVHEALQDRSIVTSAARRIASRNSYRRSDVEYVLTHPEESAQEILGLLAQSAQRADDGSLHDALQPRMESTAALVTSLGRETALLRLTGGWTLRDSHQPVILVPTNSLGPLVITRLLDDGQIVVIYGPPRDRTKEFGSADVVAISRALSNEQRLAILAEIRFEPASGQTLAKRLGLTQATVHYHTSMLRSAGLITTMRDARSVLHVLDRDRVPEALAAIGRVILGDHAEG